MLIEIVTQCQVKTVIVLSGNRKQKLPQMPMLNVQYETCTPDIAIKKKKWNKLEQIL